MSDLLAAAAAALGVPEPLVERSAAARAAETGSSVEEVLAAWAGGEAIAAGAPVAEPSAPAEPAAVEIEAPPVAEPGAVGIEPAAATLAPLPSEVTSAEAANLPEVVTVPTAGIREQTNFVIPKWLVAVMLIIPLFALFALGGSATGACGEATELATDVITGEIVNCDGSEFTGSEVAGPEVDFLALGEAIYTGAEAAANCAGCHGAGGGGGVGPAMNGVITTFGLCADHIEWVDLGTPGFQAEGRATYGDSNKPVGGGGVMPGFGSLSDEQLAAVSAYERVAFAGGDPDQVLADCGLAGEEGTGEEGAEPGGEGTDETGGEGAEASSAQSS